MKKFFKKLIYKLCQKYDLVFYSQIRYILPRIEWEQVVVCENNEELVRVSETKKLVLNLVHKNYDADYRVRKTIADKLSQVSQLLPGRYKLVLIEGYRSLEHQQYGWDQKCAALRTEHSDWTNEQIESTVALISARPSVKSNHITGGAVDVTLCDDAGNLLDMGSPYPSTPNDMQYRDKFPMFAKDLTSEQEKNRKILRDIMTRAGFVYYPGEWWHYCYGDRMWAVYTGRSKCMYGAIDPLY
jgi:D-alanyl-D-alanine dipeptidase